MCLINMEASNMFIYHLYLYLYLIIYIYIDISAYLFQASWKDRILFYLKQSIVIEKIIANEHLAHHNYEH